MEQKRVDHPSEEERLSNVEEAMKFPKGHPMRFALLYGGKILREVTTRDASIDSETKTE